MKLRCKNSVDPANYHLRSGCELNAGTIYEGEPLVWAWQVRFLVFNEQREWKLYAPEYFEPAWSDAAKP